MTSAEESLLRATTCGDLENVKKWLPEVPHVDGKIIIKIPGNLNPKCLIRKILLNEAVIKGHYDIVEYFLTNGLVATSSALSCALLRKHFSIADLLLTHGNRNLPLTMTSADDLETCRFCVSRGGDVDDLLYSACRDRKDELVEYLISPEVGGNPETIRKAGITSAKNLAEFYTAIQTGTFDTIVQMINTQKVYKGDLGENALTFAVSRGDPEIVEYLLSNGYFLSKQSYWDAIKKIPNLEIAKLIVKYIKPINLWINDVYSFALYNYRRGVCKMDVPEYFLTQGAYIHSYTEFINNNLVDACASGSIENVRELLDIHEADMYAFGGSPMAFAKLHRRQEIIDLLTSRGYDETRMKGLEKTSDDHSPISPTS